MTTTEVTRWVEKLDSMTADQIAALFREEGVKGIPGVSMRCPIANFLASKGRVVDISVSGASVVWREVIPDETGRIGIKYGRFISESGNGGIREFVSRFDRGAYSELRSVRLDRYCPPTEEVLELPTLALAGSPA